MKMCRLSDLRDVRQGHILQELLPGEYLYAGGLAFEKPGHRSHTNDGPDGKNVHIHTDCEAFVIVQGSGVLELNASVHPVTTGDVVIVEPGEDHHLHSSMEDPIVALWLHAGANRHKNQMERGIHP